MEQEGQDPALRKGELEGCLKGGNTCSFSSQINTAKTTRNTAGWMHVHEPKVTSTKSAPAGGWAHSLKPAEAPCPADASCTPALGLWHLAGRIVRRGPHAHTRAQG